MHFFFNTSDGDKVVLHFTKPHLTILSCDLYNTVFEYLPKRYYKFAS